jgi:hypothetical protein
MTCGYGIDAIDAARKNQRRSTNICFARAGATKALRVSVPIPVMGRADEVIE